MVKVNENTFKGSNSSSFIFVSLIIRGQLLKERICSSRSKFFSLRVYPFWLGYIVQRRKQEVQKLFPFVEIVEEQGGVLTHLKV